MKGTSRNAKRVVGIIRGFTRGYGWKTSKFRKTKANATRRKGLAGLMKQKRNG